MKLRTVSGKQAIIMASIGLAVGVVLALAGCRAYYSAVLQRGYVPTRKVDGFVAQALASCGDGQLADPLPAENMPRDYP